MSWRCSTCTPKIPHWLQWCTPNSPPKVPLLVDRSTNPTICLILGSVQPTMAYGSDPPFFHNALDRLTDRLTETRMYGLTDCPRESLTTIGCCATRATWPTNKAKYNNGKQYHTKRIVIIIIVIIIIIITITIIIIIQLIQRQNVERLPWR